MHASCVRSEMNTLNMEPSQASLPGPSGSYLAGTGFKPQKTHTRWSLCPYSIIQHPYFVRPDKLSSFVPETSSREQRAGSTTVALGVPHIPRPSPESNCGEKGDTRRLKRNPSATRAARRRLPNLRNRSANPITGTRERLNTASCNSKMQGLKSPNCKV